MHVINACRCKYAYFSDTLYHYALAAKVETQNLASHEEGVQFSRVIIYMINSAILASHKGKSIYSSAYNCLLDCNGVDGRRKILRLYWAGAVIFTTAIRATGITAAKILCHVVFGSIFIFLGSIMTGIVISGTYFCNNVIIKNTR